MDTKIKTDFGKQTSNQGGKAGIKEPKMGGGMNDLSHSIGTSVSGHPKGK